MDDLSAYLKRGFQKLHQKTLAKEYKQKTIEERREDYTYNRRRTRETLMLQKRNIDLNNLSPCTPVEDKKNKNAETTNVRPGKSKTVDGLVVIQKSNRLEMLKKWKTEKEKKKMEEKKNAKPQFKVFHVPVSLGLPDLEDVNRFIKGKPIKKQESFRSNFAPVNHKFKPPKNIAPIPLQTITKTNLNAKSNSPFVKRRDIKDKIQKLEPKKTENIVTRSKSDAKVKCQKNSEFGKNNVSQSLKKTASSKYATQTEEMFKNTIVNKKPVNRKKGVMWNEVEIIDSDDEVLVQEIKTKRSRKIYNKTPVKKQSLKIRNESTNKMRRSLSSEDLPVNMTPVKPALSKNKSNFCTPQQKSINDDTINFSKKITASPSFDNIVDTENCSSNSDDDNFINCRSLKPRESSRNNRLDDLSIQEKQTSQIKISSNMAKERTVLYSDEEITLKTPIKKSKKTTSKNSRISSSTPIEKTSTPKKIIQNEPPIYISPFVTISRGKNSARKEYKFRLSTGGTVPNSPEFTKHLKNTSPRAAAAYFTKKLDQEIDRIEELCSKWCIMKHEIPEEGQDMIDAAIGQSRLLISKKFQQFKKLIIMCEKSTDIEKPVTCTDLHGYWDTMYMQVEDIDKRFNNLQHLKEKGWKELLMPDQQPVKKRPKGRSKKIEAQSKIKDMIKNARMGKKNANLDNGNGELPEEKTEPHLIEQPFSTKKRKSLLESTLSNKQNNKLSCSPGMAMLKLSQAIKCGDGLTPSKSILKTEGNKSEKRSTKSVYFKDIEDNKENSFENLMTFSPVTPRRSRRLSRVT